VVIPKEVLLCCEFLQPGKTCTLAQSYRYRRSPRRLIEKFSSPLKICKYINLECFADLEIFRVSFLPLRANSLSNLIGIVILLLAVLLLIIDKIHDVTVFIITLLLRQRYNYIVKGVSDYLIKHTIQCGHLVPCGLSGQAAGLEPLIFHLVCIPVHGLYLLGECGSGLLKCRDPINLAHRSIRLQTQCIVHS